MPISTEPLNVLDILRSIPDSVLTIDADKRLIALNDPAQALTGAAESAAVGRPCAQVLRSEICDTERCPFHRSLLGGETVTTFNVVAKDAAGAETPICINTSPLKNAKGDVVGVVETIRVVTHIDRLIEELREQHNKVQAVLDSVAEGVVTVNRDGTATRKGRALSVPRAPCPFSWTMTGRATCASWRTPWSMLWFARGAEWLRTDRATPWRKMRRWSIAAPQG